MNSESEKKIQAVIDSILVGSVIDNARIESLQLLSEIIAKEAGIQSLDGLSVRAWLEKEKRERLTRKMFWLEDIDPEHAARLQTLLTKFTENADKHRPAEDSSGA